MVICMNFEQVLELVKTVSDSELTVFQYEEGNQRIVMQTGNVLFQEAGAVPCTGSLVSEGGTVTPVSAGGCVTAAGAGATVNVGITDANDSGVRLNVGNLTVTGGGTASTATAASGNVVTSPLVGRFYTAPAEDAEVYVKVGDTVKKGQVLALVEAMKLMNEIESDFDGVVTEILADNGQGVEYGQPLFKIA